MQALSGGVFGSVGSWLEGLVEGTQRLGGGLATVGSAVSVAHAHVRLAQSAQPEAPEALRLSEEQQAELRQQLERTTLRLLWQLTQRDVEDTARAVVAKLLQEPGLEPRRRQARADALLLVGGVFGQARGFEQAVHGGPAPVGERVRGKADYALDRLNQATDAADRQLLPHLQVAAVQAGEAFSGLIDSVFGTTSRSAASARVSQ